MSDEATARQRAAQLSLFDIGESSDAAFRRSNPLPLIRMPTRRCAVDPRHHVMLEASAGTGKTSVLVARYVNLLKAASITRTFSLSPLRARPAAEMRDRIIRELQRAAEHSSSTSRRWLRRATASVRSRSARSTRSACRCCVSSRWKRTLIRDSSWPTRLKCRALSTALDRALRIIVNLARGCRRCLAWRSSGWPGHAKVSRRCSTGGWSRDALNRFLAREPRDLTHRVCLPGCRPVAARHAADDPGRARRVRTDGPGTIPATICWSARSANCRHCTKRRRRPFEPCSIASAATSSPTKARRASRPARSISRRRTITRTRTR